MATRGFVRLCLLTLAVLSMTAHAAPPPPAADITVLNHGRFRALSIYSPKGTPTSFVLMLSGDDGWKPATGELARQYTATGAMVAGIDLQAFLADLEKDAAQCVFPDGDLENLSHFVQAYFHLPTYLRPILVGDAAGATFAYGILAQAPQDTFLGALTHNFCPAFRSRKPLCKGSGLELTVHAHGTAMDLSPAKSLGNPWVDIEADAGAACKWDTVRNFVAQIPAAKTLAVPKANVRVAMLAAFDQLANRRSAQQAALPPAALGDLPVVEIPARPGAPANDSFALIMSGDGGWAGLDEDVAAALSARGIAVIGLDSLRYYWTKRTPEGLAADTDRIIRYYLASLKKSRVMLIGYSQGADVLPFAVNRLPPATRQRVALAAVMGMSEHALFEFHLTSWVSDDDSGPPTMPEMNRITGMPVLCIYGEDESDTLCPKLDPARVKIVKVKGGHHFNGDYAGLAEQILAAAKP